MLIEVRMKSCFALIAAAFLAVFVVGGGGLVWYLSKTTEFSRAAKPLAAAPGLTDPNAPPARAPESP
jgi:hypothetical protein